MQGRGLLTPPRHGLLSHQGLLTRGVHPPGASRLLTRRLLNSFWSIVSGQLSVATDH